MISVIFAGRLSMLCFSAFRLCSYSGDWKELHGASSSGASTAAESAAPSPVAEGDGDAESKPEVSLPLPLVIPKPGGTFQQYGASLRDGGGVDWPALFHASARFLAIEHGFRLITEPGTRIGL